MTQGNSIAGALHTTFGVPAWVTGIVITLLSLLIIVGGTNLFQSIFHSRSGNGNLLCNLWSYCYYWKYLKSAGRYYYDL